MSLGRLKDDDIYLISWNFNGTMGEYYEREYSIASLYLWTIPVSLYRPFSNSYMYISVIKVYMYEETTWL